MSIERVLRLASFALLLPLTAFAHDSRVAPAATTVVIDGATLETITNGRIENGRIRIEAGKIVAIGGDEVSLAEARVIDAHGKQVYPGFIAAHSVLGLVEVEAVRATVDQAEVGMNTANVRAEVAVNPDSDLIPVTRANGVLMALTVPQASPQSVITGRSALLRLDGWTWEDMTVRAPVGLHVVWPTLDLPPWLPKEVADTARKGIAEKRRALDLAFEQARAYGVAERAGKIDVPDLKLAAMQDALQGRSAVFIHANDVVSIGEALDFAERESLQVVIVGGQEAWRVADRLHRLQVGVIVTGTHRLPLRRYDALDSSYTAAVKLAEAGVPFVLSTPGDSFDTTNLRNLPYQAATAVAFGLSRDEALKAITLYPAKLFGVADQYGSLEVGKQATLFIANGDPLEASTAVEAAFIDGREIDLSNRQTRLYEKYRAKYAQ